MLYGFKWSDGVVVCVDCDIYPPDTEPVREPTNDECYCCGQTLGQVLPVGEAAA